MKNIIIILILLFCSGSSAVYAEPSMSTIDIQNNFIPKGSLDVAKTAINSRGSLKVAFVGDSITKGSYLLDSGELYVNKVMDNLTDLLPNVNVSYQNFSIGGMTSGFFLNPSFKQTSSTPTFGSGFFETWGVIGKSWRDTVKDYNPDLLIVAFGMNDANGNSSVSDETIASNLENIIADANTWTSKPSIVLVTPILPTKDLTKYTQRQDVTMSVVRAIKAVGNNKHLAVADANRLFSVLRDGKDTVNTITYTYENWDNYNSNWIGDTTYFNISNNSLSTTSADKKIISTTKNFYNGTIDVDITPISNSDAGVTWIDYRSSDLGKMTVLVGAGSGTGYLRLYSWDTTSNYTMIQQISNLNIPLNQITHLKIEAKEDHHLISINANKLIDIKTYSTINDGSISIKSGVDPSVLSNLAINYRDPFYTNPSYSELDLLGNFNGLNINGNGINHPTPLAQLLTYYSSFFGIIKELAR